MSKALQTIIADAKLDLKKLDGVMISTTHFTNAIIERRRLEPTVLYPKITFKPALGNLL
jgi:N-methylhydantoinase A/oxoprolinase/acetone carboxylase beta subunit